MCRIYKFHKVSRILTVSVLPSLATSMVATQFRVFYSQVKDTALRARANCIIERGIFPNHGNSDPDCKFWCFSCTAMCSSEKKLLLARFFLRPKLLSGLVTNTGMVEERDKTTRCNYSDVYYQTSISRASLCPSSGKQDRLLPHTAYGVLHCNKSGKNARCESRSVFVWSNEL